MAQPSPLSKKALRTAEQPISYLMSLAFSRRDLISLAAGFVDNQTLPTEEILQASKEILADPKSAQIALQYGTTQGNATLRRHLIDRFARREQVDPAAMSLTSDHVIITNGSQQLLYLVASVLIDPGDIVLLPRPAYFVYMGTLQIFGTQAIGIDMDEQGMRIDQLEETLQRLEAEGRLNRVKMLYVCSYFDNPTGLSLSEPRRRQLIDLVRRWRQRQAFYVLEDAAYRDLVYDVGADAPTLKSMDQDNTAVILAQTFSKPLAPGLKTGYGFLPQGLIGPVLDQKGNHDFGSANYCQHIILHLIENGAADRHVERLCQTYRRKRDAMLEAMEDNFGDLRQRGLVSWTRPGGGLYVWVTLPQNISTDLGSPLFDRCLETGVIYVPGSFCYLAEEGREIPRNQMRLSFGVPSVEDIRNGVCRLAAAVHRELEERHA